MPKKYTTPRDEYMGARVSLRDKLTIQENNYTAADGLAYFAEELRGSNPRKKVAIQRRMIDIQLEYLKREECEIQLEIERLENQRSSLAVEVQNKTSIVSESVEDEELPSNLKEAITRIQYAFDRKKDWISSPSKTNEEIITEFMELNDDFILTTYKEFGKGLDWRDWKGLVISEIIV